MSGRFKVVLIGDSSVGKTSLAKRYINGSFDDGTTATIGSTNFELKRETDGNEIILDLWDTAGQEKYRSLAPMYYQRADAAILVYDITARRTLQELDNFLLILRDKAPMSCKLFVVGNKYDLEKDRDVDYEELEDFAQKVDATYYGETSAMNGYGVESLFTSIFDSFLEVKVTEGKKLIEAEKKQQCGC